MTKESSKLHYIDINHKNYCQQNKDASILTHPITSKTLRTIFPIYTIKKNFAYALNDGIKFKSFFQPGLEFSMNNYNKSVSLNLYDPNDEEIVDPIWFKKTNKYIKSLNTRDTLTIVGYTFHGDVWANTYLRGKFDILEFYKEISNIKDFWLLHYMPLFFQALDVIKSYTTFEDIIIKDSITTFKEQQLGKFIINSNFLKNNISVTRVLQMLNRKNISTVSKYIALAHVADKLNTKFWFLVLELFCKDLNRIINNSPPLRKNMVVFRGVKNDYYLKRSKQLYYRNEGFISSSMYYNKAKSFASYIESSKRPRICCLKRITLPPGTRCLFISGLSKFPEEFEILLSSNSVYHIRNQNSIYKIYKNEYIKERDICADAPTNLKYLHVTDVTLKL
jgi:hypothetical protein